MSDSTATSTRWRWLGRLSGGGRDSARTAAKFTAEELAAQNNHDVVASWISHCLGVQNFRYLPLNYLTHFNVGNYQPTYFGEANAVSPKQEFISPDQQAVLTLSKAIYVQRSDLDRSKQRLSTSLNSLHRLQ